MKRVLVDTNAYTALLAGEEAVLDALASADAVLMSAMVLGELHAGFKGGRKERINLKTLGDFLRRPAVRTLDVTSATAEVFGVVKHALKVAGTPIPINDVWIAAHAIESGSWLVTYDRHFTHVPGLLLWEECRKET
jgi:tRNA(fMet)-specific endonuclease VapC